MKLILIDNYDSFTFNLYQMLVPLVQSHSENSFVQVFRNDAIGASEVLALAPDRIVLSPGPGHPSKPRDFGVCADLIKDHAQHRIPIFGVCLGLQGIVHHLGGKVVSAPEIVHGKVSEMEITGDSRILQDLPQTFKAMRYHSLIAEDESLPDCLFVTARESRRRLIMAIEHKTSPLFGVQFHPESIGTPEGSCMLSNFVNLN